MENYYEILNISQNADSEEIKKAFRNLAMQYHPDKNPGDKIAEEKFKKVNEAYSILSDPLKKQEYDFTRIHRTQTGSYRQAENYNPFDDIFNQGGFEFRTYTWSAKQKKEKKLTRKEALAELLTGIFYILIGILLIRSFIFLGILGLILSFSVISNGIRKVKRAYSAVFK